MLVKSREMLSKTVSLSTWFSLQAALLHLMRLDQTMYPIPNIFKQQQHNDICLQVSTLKICLICAKLCATEMSGWCVCGSWVSCTYLFIFICE